jgi:hypothetical protein
VNTRIPTRQSIALLGITLALVATACGTKTNASAQVASLGSTSGSTPTATTVPVNTQDALLKYAACMRSNGVDMADPTFDADGNPTGGGFGRNSGVDRSTPEFQTAQKACGNLLQGITLGGGRGGNFNRQAIQDGLNDFTACLRDEGLAVDDITFGPPAGAAGGNGGATAGSVPGGGGTGRGFGGGGFGGPPAGGSAPANGGRPGGAGFDPTARIIDRLGLDNTDPKVIAALAKCQPLITKAFQPPTSTTTATTP